jgi:hypothetical protein
MRKTLTTAALVLALSGHAWAGIIHIPPAPDEPTPTNTTTTQETVTTDEDSGAADTLTQNVLTLLVSLLP